jgi:diguanylate cyclase (GGDEF)-like protein
MQSPRPRRPRRAKDFQLTLTRALLESLDLESILYVILSGATAGDGLDFNRALLLLVDEGDRCLRGQLAIGPASAEEAHRIWEAMEVQRFDLARVLRAADDFRRDARARVLSTEVRRLSWALPLQPGASRAQAMATDVLATRSPRLENRHRLALPPSALVLDHLALVPLVLADRPVGLLAVDNAYNGRPIRARELDDLTTVANLAAIAVERARMIERLRRMAERDGLTGLANRRHFDEAYPRTLAAGLERGEALALVVFDVDHLKPVNDRHGHLAGDDALRGVAETVRGRLRACDLAARYGGDEFALVLPRASGAAAAELAEALRRAVEARGFGPAADLHVTLSLGVAEARPGDSPEGLLARADGALYDAKRRGRNRVEYASG